MQFLGVITGTLMVLSTMSTAAQTPVPVRPTALCLWSDRLPECRSFLTIEAHAHYRVTASADGQSKFYLTGELGWMRNLDESKAIGASGFGGYDWDSETTRGGLKVRYRRWLAGPHRVDLSIGGFLTSAEDGGVGVLAGIEYGLADALLLAAELDYAPVERHLAYDWRCIPEVDYSECLLDRATSPTLFLGFGLGRKWGAATFLVAGCLGVLAAGTK